tara:strand:+ start:950 stop:1360 length:411 start_codon:yes stop_codon:yes gene_type:complete
MKKSTKYMIASAGLLVIGVLVYFKLESLNNIEDNGMTPSESNAAAQEEENTTGANAIVVGEEIYPSGEYVNVRSSAEVNNGWFNNIIVEIPTPNRIGIVDSIVVSDGHTWYNVQLNQEFTNENYGWVRADVVTKNI